MTVQVDELSETDLAQDVCCEFGDCDSPANFRMRMHLPVDNELSECSTRSLHACTAHKDEMIDIVADLFSSGRAAGALPLACLCGRKLHTTSDVILWIHPLR
jgi:hypothetical protein